MPPPKQRPKDSISPSIQLAHASQRSTCTFKFPGGSHLLITTRRHVFAWDDSGLHTIFQSRSGGIVAAREAKDASGMLAVAGSHVVVMHDTRRGKEESWGLPAPQDEVRHLEYSPDATTLFLATTADGIIHRYSTDTSRLLDPAHKHDDAAAPVAVAVSATGHLLLSASHNPPVVHLKNLANDTSPVQLLPNASHTPVSFAVFHPERPNVFLLAFRDGTIAAYEATRLAKMSQGACSSTPITDGEICHLANLHRPTIAGDDPAGKTIVAAPIAGAAFLPGFKTRAVTAGRDGKCKLVDFAMGGVVLRSWHAKAPLTSVSVLPLKSDSNASGVERRDSRSRRKHSSASHTIGGPTTTDSLIAVSRVDGKVQIYDSVGLLQSQETVTGQEEKILTVEWAKGPSPRPLESCAFETHFSDATVASLVGTSKKMDHSSRPSTSSRKKSAATQPERTFSLGLPPALKSSTPRKLTIHPDEIEECTVRYTPGSKQAAAVPPIGVEYHDLFSPPRAGRGRPLISSPLRNRPRISSQTFVQSPPIERSNNVPGGSARNPALLPAIDSHATSSSSRRHHERSAMSQPKSIRKTVQHVSPTRRAKRISFSHIDGSARSRENASILPPDPNVMVNKDLQKFAIATSSSQNRCGSLSCATSQQRKVSLASAVSGRTEVRPARNTLGHHDHSTSTFDSLLDMRDDAWLTSESESDSSRQRWRIRHASRPPARQTSRAQVDSRGTISTTAAPDRMDVRNVVDGSTEEDTFATAGSQISSPGIFSPASEEVRQLFPRSSSLSPSKKKKRRSPRRKDRALAEVAFNSALGRQPRSPWARLKTGTRLKPIIEVFPNPGSVLPRSEGHLCLTCPDTNARVRFLESEIVKLKGEVRSLKTVLRRNGIHVSRSSAWEALR